MRITLISLLLLLISCSKDETIKLYDPALEVIKCRSKHYAYVECTTVNEIEKILNVLPRRAEDCRKGTDYYMLDSKTLVVRNNCKADFILQIKR